MTRDTQLKLLILVGTAACGGVLLAFGGVRFSLGSNLAAAGVVAALGPPALFYHHRDTPQFATTLTAIMFLMVYTSCFTVLMYGAAALGGPLIDDRLIAADQAFGVHVPAIVAWAERHPLAGLVLELAYSSAIPQTLLVVVLLGFEGQRRDLENFVLQFMLGLTLTAAIFCVAPAAGPFVGYGYEPSAAQGRYLEHLYGLRAGTHAEVTLKDAEGLVTFPSFHTAWAIFLAFACRHRRGWFFPVAALNALMIAATLTTGWHYFCDVLGGFVLAAATILLVQRLESWRYPGPISATRSASEDRRRRPR